MQSNLFIKEIKLKKENIVNYSQYPFSLSVVKNFSDIKINSPVTFFIGENCSEKSTLIKAITVNYGFNPEGGSKNINFSTNESHSVLHNFITAVKTPNKPHDGFFKNRKFL
jgi:predicted ATPase